MPTTKSVRVYDYEPRFESRFKIAFVQPNEDRPGLYASEVYVDRETWEAMGSPNKFTVTLEPGDLLNG